ncbi:MAG: hypothetical protein FWG50_04895 [Kiritimatiellaeota bacterium]|nr:hypothetical protein [Kiritimatiellota bacterium]
MNAIREVLPQDEAELQRLTRQPMPGWIRLAYCNSPSYAAGEALKGDTVTTVVWTETGGHIGGCATRAVKRMWLAGQCQRIGYLAGLRSFQTARGGRGLFKGYEWMREREQREPLPLYITTIVSANHATRTLLTSRRAGLPAYSEAGEITTFGVTARAIRRRFRVADGYAVSAGDTVGEERLRSFYDEVSPRRTLFPILPDPLPPGLAWSDFVILEKDGEIAAAAALWNQQPLRQIHVASYHPLLAMARPVINPFLAMSGYPRLPSAGTDMDCVYWAYRLTRHETLVEFESLLAATALRLRHHLLFFALHEDSPLLPVAIRLTAWHYRSTLYTVSFAPNPIPYTFPQPPHIELAAL